jgi:hypothetical protein
MFLMATNRTTDKITTTEPDKTTEEKPASVSRLFHRNGHEKKSLPPVKPQGPTKTVWREYFESAVVTVIMALFGMTFIVQAVKVPTGSMQNTITIGDHLLVNKFIFAPGKSLPFLPQARQPPHTDELREASDWPAWRSHSHPGKQRYRERSGCG